MRTLLVANPKGGSGKTTLAVNLAGYLASQGHDVAVMDMDRQGSAQLWLDMRELSLPHIARYTQKTAPDWLVIDSPAGVHGKLLERLLKLASHILVPIAPSPFDIAASQDFLSALREEKAVRKGRVTVGVVGMRFDPRTRMGLALQDFIRQHDLPVLAWLRHAQSYVNAASEGKSLFDLPPGHVKRDLEQWQPLIQWLNQETF